MFLFVGMRNLIFSNRYTPFMKAKQSILEDYGEFPNITVKDIIRPDQKYIHFWDFLDLDDSVFEFSARMGYAISDMKKNMKKRYLDYYTNAQIQTPEKFTKHAGELQEIEFMLENPFFLAILHFALTKELSREHLHRMAISYKKRLMERRMGMKETLEKDILYGSDLLIK
jgi:hypothetical protein